MLHRGDENEDLAGVVASAMLRGSVPAKTPRVPVMDRPRRVVWSARRTEGCCSGAFKGREHEGQDVPSSRAGVGGRWRWICFTRCVRESMFIETRSL
jgi:hypothetical protein